MMCETSTLLLLLLKDSFENVEAHSMIIDFIKETPFYKQLQCLQTLHINVCYLLFIVA